MPDLNSVPASPHILASNARRTSTQQMPPPPVPPSPSLNILPSNQSIVHAGATSSSLPSPHFSPPVLPPPSQPANAAIGSGPGPLRHPRPLTAADLHLQLEKEQEAVVNRLTRELSILRAAQNASVVSNASSTSATGSEPMHAADPPSFSAGSGFSHPVAGGRRHHRTSSNASARSFTANLGSASTVSVVGAPTPGAVRPGNQVGSVSMSRHDSTASRRSRAGSPAPLSAAATPSSQQPPQQAGEASYFTQHRTSSAPLASSGPVSVATPAAAALVASTSEISPGVVPATPRYEETAFYRAELESVKRENEVLKRRVRELERMVRERRASDASRASQSRSRSESSSTVASVSVAASATGPGGGTVGGGGGGGASIAGQRDGRQGSRVASMISTAGSVGVGVPDDEVKVGESAASAGLRERQEGS